ncbi:hypothetical protein C7U89_22985 [Bradyrhizobium sp. WBOS4]|nr:hypothetical protein [Bradyrhizobium sp. WBOS8]MDD1585781.1 hypothetical protein [Bradyrhizobium sp. WBOS4]UUO60264.1 hypothetical protein DCM80_14445 [Bradyrhizobium sp. WBOS08]
MAGVDRLGCGRLPQPGAAAFLQGHFARMQAHATKCMSDVESLLPRNDTAITHFSALKRQGELFH